MIAVPSSAEGEGEADDGGPFSGGELSSVIPQPAMTSASGSATKVRDAGPRLDVTACVLVLGWTAHAPGRVSKDGRIPCRAIISAVVFRVRPAIRLKKQRPMSPIPDVASVCTDAATVGKGMDTDLVTRAQGGDQEAFADLVYAIADRFLAVSHRILSDIDLAEDATQQALLTVWQDLPQLRDPARFEAWSYRLLVRACYAEGRKSRRWAPNMRLLSVDEPMVADGTSGVVDRDQLERAFRRLSLNHRTVVVLHHYLDLPLDRVADIVGAPLGTVGSRLHYATRQLRSALIADAQPASREVAR